MVSYDINVLVLGIKENIVMPGTKLSIIESEYASNSGGRYGEMYPFMTMQEGTWVQLLNPAHTYSGAFGLCDGDFEYPKERIKYPYWVTETDVRKHDLVPLIIFDQYMDEFNSIIHYLINKSPIGKIMFLSKLQAYNPEIVCGTITTDNFFKLLANREILFNICYILEKGVYT